MTCPVCNGKTRIKNSRKDGVDRVRRRRECRSCLHRFTTMEYAVRRREGGADR